MPDMGLHSAQNIPLGIIRGPLGGPRAALFRATPRRQGPVGFHKPPLCGHLGSTNPHRKPPFSAENPPFRWGFSGGFRPKRGGFRPKTPPFSVATSGMFSGTFLDRNGQAHGKGRPKTVHKTNGSQVGHRGPFGARQTEAWISGGPQGTHRSPTWGGGGRLGTKIKPNC